MADRKRLQTVAETRVFSEEIDALLSEAEREAIIASIAAEPDGGDLIPGAAGLRKRRIPLPGRGKRGGARVITFTWAIDTPFMPCLCTPRTNAPICRRSREGYCRKLSKPSKRK
jgi:hypothetical protein